MDPASVASRGDESGVAQRAQVVRHEGLTEAGGRHEIGDRVLAVGKDFEEPKARFVAQGAESECRERAAAVGVGHSGIYEH